MRHRQVAAVLALAGLMLSAYLVLQRMGLLGALVCGTGSCETVQASRWSEFLGVPVAGWGVAGYLGLFAVAFAGVQGRWAEQSGPTKLLALLSGIGVAFTLYLTYLELFVIHAVCRWCVGSAVIIVAVFISSLAGLRAGSNTGKTA